jgi:hypothetical protein
MLIKNFFHGLLIACTCFLPVIALGIFYLVIGNAFSHHYLHAKLIDAQVVRSCGPVPCEAYNLREIFQINGNQNCSLYRRQEFTTKEAALEHVHSVVVGSEREIWTSWDNPHTCYDIASKNYFTLVGTVLLSVFPGFPLAILIVILFFNLLLLIWQQFVKFTREQQQRTESLDDQTLESGIKDQELTVTTDKSLEITVVAAGQSEITYSRVSSDTDMEEVTTPSQFDDSEV